MLSDILISSIRTSRAADIHWIFKSATEANVAATPWDVQEEGGHINKMKPYNKRWGTRWRNWLRHRATSRKVASSIPDGVIWIFHWHNPSGRTIALGLNQTLTEMSTRIFPRGKGGRCVELTILPPSRGDCLEIWEPQPTGTFRACPGLYRDCFTFFFIFFTIRDRDTKAQLATRLGLKVSCYWFTISYFTTLPSITSLKSISPFNCFHVDPNLYTFCFHVCSYRITTNTGPAGS